MPGPGAALCLLLGSSCLERRFCTRLCIAGTLERILLRRDRLLRAPLLFDGRCLGGLGLALDPLGIGEGMGCPVRFVLRSAGTGLCLRKRLRRCIARAPERIGALLERACTVCARSDIGLFGVKPLRGGIRIFGGIVEPGLRSGKVLPSCLEDIFCLGSCYLCTGEDAASLPFLETIPGKKSGHHLACHLLPPHPAVRDILAPVLECGVDALVCKDRLEGMLRLDSVLGYILA